MPRKPLTWILTGVMLLTSAAAGQAYLATEPGGDQQPAVSTETPGKSGAANAQPAGLQSLELLSAQQHTLESELEQLRNSNLDLLGRLEKLQASLAPEAAGENTH